ncbi:uncharacterized protein LOC115359048 [Myripristis murdjan]|uniref:uncharacterized protein LOC115359048 n=1 Tax=Myripristis murdjan TaxID=586833 RepID=UPI001175F959|nr:uncharacterized protein LOC115359048 [Myripristis murdjan]
MFPGRSYGKVLNILPLDAVRLPIIIPLTRQFMETMTHIQLVMAPTEYRGATGIDVTDRIPTLALDCLSTMFVVIAHHPGQGLHRLWLLLDSQEDRQQSQHSPSPGHVRFHSPSHTNPHKVLNRTQRNLQSSVCDTLFHMMDWRLDPVSGCCIYEWPVPRSPFEDPVVPEDTTPPHRMMLVLQLNWTFLLCLQLPTAGHVGAAFFHGRHASPCWFIGQRQFCRADSLPRAERFQL